MYVYNVSFYVCYVGT